MAQKTGHTSHGNSTLGITTMDGPKSSDNISKPHIIIRRYPRGTRLELTTHKNTRTTDNATATAKAPIKEVQDKTKTKFKLGEEII